MKNNETEKVNSRPLKFRTWNKVIKTMNYLKPQKEEGSIDMLMLPVVQDIIMMQYTGLKDKNGVEIYEGDIVKGIMWEDDTSTTSQHERIGKVVFDTLKFVVKEFLSTYCQDGCTEMGIGWENMEVIGNIYENPELK